MLGEEFGHIGLDRLGQQGARSVAQHLGKRVGERPWLKQLDDVSIGHGVSLLCWISGGSNTPTIRRLLPVRPSPTSAHSSETRAIVRCRRGVSRRRISPVGLSVRRVLYCGQSAIVALPAPAYGRSRSRVKFGERRLWGNSRHAAGIGGSAAQPRLPPFRPTEPNRP